MSIFKRFDKARKSGKYFNEAKKYWKHAEQVFKAKDEVALTENLIEVIRNCQLAIVEDDNCGDAYVLLADALLLASVFDPIRADKERSWYLATQAAAVIYTWYTLPNRGYPVTKNVRRGEKLFQTLLGIVNAGESEAIQYPEKLINSYRERYASNIISPEGLEEISDVLLKQTNLDHKEHTPTANETLVNYPLLEETLLPDQRDFIFKVIHRLSNTSISDTFNQRKTRLNRIQEMTEDLRDPSRILATSEEILNRIKNAYEQKDWRQMLGWIADLRLINDYRRNKQGYDEAAVEKMEMNWAKFLAPTINESRRVKDIDTMLLAIGYNHYLGIDDVAAKLLEEVRNEVDDSEIMVRIQKISESPIMLQEQAIINKTREFINEK